MTRRLALLLLALPILVAVLGPWLAPHDPVLTSSHVLAPPSSQYLLGTDALGRDVLSRVLAGGSGLIGVSLSALLVGEVLGVTLGIAAAAGRRLDRTAILALTELLLAIPSLLLSVLVAGFGESWLLLVVATVCVLVPSLIPVIRTRTLTLLEQPWMHAALLAGERGRVIIHRELLPNLLPVIAADAGVRLLSAAFMVSTAGFLGFGPHPKPDWGLMIADARATATLQPWQLVAPALMIVCFALGATLFARRFGVTAPTRAIVRRTVSSTPRSGDAPLATVWGLTVHGADGSVVLDHVDLTVEAGSAIAVLGSSGAGKTTLGLALLGHFRHGLIPVAGTIEIHGEDLLGANPPRLRELRRKTVRHVPQDPSVALTPTLRVSALLKESGADDALLRLVRLPAEREFLRRYPHQLSGGQRQRLALAMALAGVPGAGRARRTHGRAGRRYEPGAWSSQRRPADRGHGTSDFLMSSAPPSSALNRQRRR
jgi:ABC-type dipeptide/oligopeptide/nickel transport system permease subunit/predicted ABC-type transport system involved in lysophospholipase L1 biosynthesis ATPase subunit